MVVGVALFSFIIGDFLRSGSAFINQKKENIVVINGEAINCQDYQTRVEDYINNAIRNNNNQPLTDDEQYQIKQMILNEMIDDILLFKEAKKLGLVVSKEEYKDLVMGDNISPLLQQIPSFRNPKTKKFDKTALLHFLQNIENEDYSTEQSSRLMSIKKAWLAIEKQIIKEQLKKKFNTLFTYSILTNVLEARAFYEEKKINVDFDYVAQSYNSIPDREVNVSDIEIQKRYNECKNLYRQKEGALVDFIALNIVPSKKDYQMIENKLKELKKQLESSKNIAEIIQSNPDILYTNAYITYNNLNESQKFLIGKNHAVGTVGIPILVNQTFNLYKFEGMKTAPDSIKLNAVMIPSSMEEIKLKHLSDSLIQVVKKGTPFSDMASTLSNGKTTGELGWMTESQLISRLDIQFKDKILTAKINEPVVIKSNIGIFLVQVLEKTKPIKKYKIANIQIQVIPSQETKTRLYNRFIQFISSNHSIADLRENAKSSGFSIQTDVEISKDQININHIQNTRQIVQWIFNNKKGAISDIFECQNSEYFAVVAIKEHLREGFRPLKSISSVLKRNLINEKKALKLISDLKVKKLNTLKQYAEAMNTTPQSVQSVNFATSYISGIGKEPILNVKVPEAPINQISGPYAGKNKIYVLYITNKNISKEPYDTKCFLKQAQIQNMRWICQIIQSPEFLRENIKIDNYFNRFF
ncbi:MAG: SurA N-terminal domain-containing protein [Candidatus Azobacteroides pseudotrichonymphae]|jgi:peptidyl-prolyl cis-trans isomerase D|nr:MAG: SurA N-terminal domain-containing protein [Candidatus Azobacteroides pseudotrichonymphae]